MTEEIKKKILIVDDEPAFTEMVKLNLEATGDYEVLIINDSSSAINAALQYQPDVIILDVIMPEPEGPDVLFYLRNHQELRNIPVIFFTATLRKDEVTADPAGYGGYVFLAKPSSLKELISCIESQKPRDGK